MLEALAIFERLSDMYDIALCHTYLAWVDQREGNLVGAIAHFREALSRFEQVLSPDAEEVRRSLRELGVEV